MNKSVLLPSGSSSNVNTVKLSNPTRGTAIIRKAFESTGGNTTSKIIGMGMKTNVPLTTIRNLLGGFDIAYNKDHIIAICDHLNVDSGDVIYGVPSRSVAIQDPDKSVETIPTVSEDTMYIRTVYLENSILFAIKSDNFDYAAFHRILTVRTANQKNSMFESCSDEDIEDYCYVLFTAIISCNGFLELKEVVKIVKQIVLYGYRKIEV